MDYIFIFLDGRLVCNISPIIELESSWHGERSILRRLLGASQFVLRFRVAAVLEESLELDFASLLGVAAFAFGDPTKDDELARLRNITVFRMNEMRWALADT